MVTAAGLYRPFACPPLGLRAEPAAIIKAYLLSWPRASFTAATLSLVCHKVVDLS